MKRVFAVVAVCILAAGTAGAQDALRAFRFDDAKVWAARVHPAYVKDVRVEGGALAGTVLGRDPFVTLPFETPLDTGIDQVVEFRARTAAGGMGEIFWQPVDAPAPLQKWSVKFDWIGDGEWHTYRVRPMWHGERRIKAMRLDFAVTDGAERPFALEWVRVVESPLEGSALKEPVSADENPFVAVEMRGKGTDGAVISWATDAVSGLHKKKVRVVADGRFHTYNIDFSAEKEWRGNVAHLNVSGDVEVRGVRVSDDLSGAADVVVEQARLADAVNRVWRKARLLVRLSNIGGTDAEGGVVQVVSAPPGVVVPSARAWGWERLPVVPAGESAQHIIELIPERAVSGDMVIEVVFGDKRQRVSVPVTFTEELKLPKAAYVPEPRPVKSGYEIGALYFPGWSKVEAWEKIWRVAPERKPVLGWYDEANAEVVDWQIKWAVENGISYFLVDWYWDRGAQHHDHWVKAFQRARYKSFLKWAVMWANHNGPGSHSEEDQRKAAAFWCENYFSTPEYYRIDGRPVVVIWLAKNFDDDMGEGGCRRALEVSQEVARAHGHKGIYFIAMKWPEASSDPAIIRKLKSDGFEMTSIYHYMDAAGKAQDSRRFAFDLVADSNKDLWERRHAAGVLPFLPNLSTGWDDRPWHGDRGIEIHGRTVAHFQRICADAKNFADAAGVKNLLLAPLNEWGEGSYAEPCAEFGFGMYEAVRDTFCERPAEGWPLNYAPTDIGLGPYDLPYRPQPALTAWDFKGGAGRQGWTAFMGCKVDEPTAGGWRLVSSTRDPAIAATVTAFRAKRFTALRVRMKTASKGADVCQLFWSAGGTPTERTSITLPLATDGASRDYVFKLSESPAWKGMIRYLRFDPCATADTEVVIESIALE
ncbi:MAG: glycoside hydrolase family 99-like domain-containing protein [Kiritimatiellaeota bacterium]|nr:glycoside hydrolase family 99-like domain-containing protein [Kiritimatiellota bacterium]